tara:strand:+ start:309 stop:1517 length:1209 start_codon:yes stop_codon:yes gene_type:complete
MKQGWEQIPLGELVKKEKFSIVDGPFGTQLNKKEYKDDGIPVIRIKNISPKGYFTSKDLVFISQEKFETIKRSAVYPGDIILAKTGGTIGKMCLFPNEIDVGLISSSCARISIDENVASIKYIMNYLRSNEGQDLIISSSGGSTRNSINLTPLKQLPIPVPSLKEQKRIVAKLDQCFESIDKARANVEKNLQNAKDLFESKLNEIFNREGDGLKIFSLGDLCEIIGGSQPPKDNFIYEPKEGYVRLIQVRDYRTDKFITYIPKESTKKFCSKNDIMIGRYGPPIFGIFSGLEGAYNVALMKAIPDEKIVLKDYFRWFLKNKKLHSFVEKSSARAAGQSGVRKELLYAYPVPVPEISVQKDIVELLNKLKNNSNILHSNYQQELEALDELKKSILEKAFNGEL